MSKNATLYVPSVIREAAEDDTEIYLVGIRENRSPESWSLIFFEAMEPDDDEVSEMDTYCLVIDPGQMTCYGGVREWELTNDRLRLLLTDTAAEELRLPQATAFKLELVEEERGILERGLTRVFNSGRPDEIPRRLPTVKNL